MCGIAGYILTESSSSATYLLSMTQAVRHRGPDDEGFAFIDSIDGTQINLSGNNSCTDIRSAYESIHAARNVSRHQIALAQVRYSIVDISSGGHQPMWSSCNSVCLTFNGEIYNHQELRSQLINAGYIFRTKSDTEVFVNAYLEWGDDVFSHLNGFWAIALYDSRRKQILLARDRLGKAHLYIFRGPDGSVSWASEIKAFFNHGAFNRFDVDKSALFDYIAFGRRDRQGTLWNQVEDFPPAHSEWLSPGKPAEKARYWDFPTDRLRSSDCNLEEQSSRFRDLLTDSLQLRSRADVPVAFELSGGLDSSALVALAARRLGLKFRAFTISFPEKEADESDFARMVVKQYAENIDHRIITPGPDSFWRDSDQFAWSQEEPFHSPNLFTNRSLRQLMKRSGTDVVITGAGADELLAGYPADYQGPYLRFLLSSGAFRSAYRELISSKEVSVTRGLLSIASDSIVSEEFRSLLAKIVSGELRSLSGASTGLIVEGLKSCKLAGPQAAFGRHVSNNMSNRMMNYWLRSGAKADYSIPMESRAPFLDHRVVEFGMRLPPEFLIHEGWNKYILRTAVDNLLPPQVTWRERKMGFPFPYYSWLTASKERALLELERSDCPFIDRNYIARAYDSMALKFPLLLWRTISTSIWWRVVVSGERSRVVDF